MSLNADWGNVKDYVEVDGVLKQSMSFATVIVGINEITEANAGEFFSRISFSEKASGAMRQDMDGPVYFTREDVDRMVGLRTNASRKTKTKFVNEVFDLHKHYLGAKGR